MDNSFVVYSVDGQWKIITFIFSQVQINQQVSIRGDSIEVKESKNPPALIDYNDIAQVLFHQEKFSTF